MILSLRCELNRVKTETDTIVGTDWNDKQGRVMVPTKSSSTIVNSLLQVYRGIHETLTKKDLSYVFEEIIVGIKDKLLDRIKTDLIIKTEHGYKLLCDELDYLMENFKEFFEDKLGFDITLLNKTIKEIENVKTANLF